MACAASLPLQAASTGETNQTVVSYVPFVPVLEPGQRSDVLGERFLQEVIASDNIVFDRFVNPASRLELERRLNDLGYAGIDQFNRDGADLFKTIGLDSLRTAAIEALPADRWQDYWLGRLASVIAGTIGNPQEEHIGVADISYSAIRSTWERENERGNVQWGFRPWRTNPYFYVLAHGGRLEGRPLLTFEGRAGYSLLGSAHLEGRLTLQLPDSFRIACGAATEPILTKSHDRSAGRIGITLERTLRSSGNHPAGVFFVGFRSGTTGSDSNRRQDNQIIAGLSREW